MTWPELKIDQQYTAEEKKEFNDKMSLESTKKELFAQKEWIKTEWKSSFYKELEGNLKIDTMNLGKKIIENKNGTAYRLLKDYLVRNGKSVQTTENDIKTGKTEKMDKYLLTAIMQAGAIAACDKASVLKNVQNYLGTWVAAKPSFAVDGDPRGNTMGALMGMFEDMKASGLVTDVDFDWGIPSANFIAQMYIYIQENPNANVDNGYTPPKQPEQKEKEDNGLEWLDITKMSLRDIMFKILNIPEGKKYRIDIDTDGKIWAEYTLQFEKNQKLTIFAWGKPLGGQYSIDRSNDDIRIKSSWFNWSLKAYKEALDARPTIIEKNIKDVIKDIPSFIRNLNLMANTTQYKLVADIDGKPGIEQTITFLEDKKAIFSGNLKTTWEWKVVGDDVQIRYYENLERKTRSLKLAKNMIENQPKKPNKPNNGNQNVWPTNPAYTGENTNESIYWSKKPYTGPGVNTPKSSKPDNTQKPSSTRGADRGVRSLPQ